MLMATARLRALRNHVSAPHLPHAGTCAAARSLSSSSRESSTWQGPTAEDVAKYNDEGFLICRGVLNQEEVALVTEAMIQNDAIVRQPCPPGPPPSPPAALTA